MDALIVRKGISKPEEEKTVSAPDFSSGNIVVTPTAGKVMTQVTVNKDTTNHIAGNIKSGVTLYGVEGNMEEGIDVSDADAGISDVAYGKTFYAGTSEKKTGTATELTISLHYVVFIDIDGSILKEEYVEDGGDATAPSSPSHSGLTFDSWNRTYTNVNRDLIVGATYSTDDDKTHIFLTIKNSSNKAIVLYFNKSDTSTLTISWGDGTSDSTNSSSGSINVTHTYSSIGDYEIKVSITSGSGGYALGYEGSSYSIIDSNNRPGIKKIWMGAKARLLGYSLYQLSGLTELSVEPYADAYDGYFCYGSSTFGYVAGLLAIIVPNGYTAFMSQYTMQINRTVKYVSMPDSVTSFGNNSGSSGGVFSQANALVMVTLPQPSSGLTVMPVYSFQQCMIKKIEVPDCIIELKVGAFKDAWGAERIIFKTSQSYITCSANDVFAYCYKLKEINKAVKLYGSYTGRFQNCVSIEEITLDSASDRLKSSDFSNCVSLKHLVVPANVSIIDGTYTFSGCSSLEYIHLQRTAGVVSLTSESCFYGTKDTLKIYVPASLVASYKAASNWVLMESQIYSEGDMP